MASNTETPARGVQGQWKWLVCFCQWCWSKRGFIWGAVILNFVLGATVTWLFTDPATLTRLPVGWVLQNITIMLIIFIIVLALTIISWAVSQIPVMPSLRQVRRNYLNCMMRETEKLALTGIPAGLIAESVYIDEVFIPVQLRPNRPRTDYPFTDVELARFRQNMQSGKFSINEERALIGAEKNWHDVLKKSDRISIADAWRLLTIDSPAAVIQGYPGMGKSTLMERLTLLMARRGLKLPDSTMPGAEAFENALVPLLIRLGKYAEACKAQPGLTLDDYLRSLLSGYAIAHIDLCIQQTLQSGQGLVLFDGLDEVSDAELRNQVQESIRTFIRNHSTHRTASSPNFNRFLITSRVAGYDLAAFPDYRHMTIAELTDEQIDYFLPRWYRANLRSQRTPSSALSFSQTTTFTREEEQKAQEMATALKSNAAVRELAENPLLLTLMLVMQQNKNSIVLPPRRVELYDVVTRTLLENRNIAKNLTPIPEDQAMQYLGPLAFAMQEESNSPTRERDVIASLCKTIAARSDAGTPEDIEREAKKFLKRIRERGGLFVERTSDYFDFMHPTFREYFAARYMLNQIKDNQQRGIDALVSRACHSDDLWREPFLLAVAYQSDKNEKVADAIITALLDVIDLGAINRVPTEQREHDLLLAAECLIEAKPLSIDATLEKDIANRLLQTYEQAQKRERFNVCEKIENVTRRWLLSLPKEAYRSSLLTELHTAVCNTGNISQQRATLTLLAIIARQLADCPKIVFEALIPPLLALTRLPAIGPYKPDTAMAASSSLDVADLALTALSFFGKPGPSGLLLTEVCQHFASNPEHLRLLARFSLECGTLLTLTVVPLQEENYRRYEAAIGDWITLRDALQSDRITEQTIEKCRTIHQTLLDCAEEVCYPTAIDLQKLLQAAIEHNTQPWQAVWQDYLTQQLDSGHYLNYQQSALLWVLLFPEEQDQKQLASHLLRHYDSKGKRVQRFAERFFSVIANDLRYLKNVRDIKGLQNLKNLSNLSNLRYLSDLSLNDMGYLSDLRYLRNLEYLKYLKDLNNLRYDVQYRRDMRNMRNMSDQILTQNIAGAAIARLSAQIEVEKQADLLIILLGRVLQVSETMQKGREIEREAQQIVRYVYPTFTTANDEAVRDCALDILRYLPARSVSGIEFVLQLADGATDKQVPEACAQALEHSAPESEKAWIALKEGRHFQMEVVRQAVEVRLERRFEDELF